MGFGPSVTTIVSTDVTAAALVPLSVASAQNQIAANNLLAGITNATVLPSGAVVPNTLIVQQSGGTPGTDEVQISHNGTRAIVESKDGSVRITLSDASFLDIAAGPLITSSNNLFFLGASTPLALGASPAQAQFGYGGGTGLVNLSEQFSGRDSCILRQSGNRKIVAGDGTNVTTALADITDLTVWVAASQKYVGGRVRLYVEEATAVDGLKLDFGGTGTWTAFRATYTATDTLSAAPLASSQVTAIGTDFVVSTLTGAAWVDIEYSGVCNAAGSLIPRYAKNSDAAGAALTLRAVSFHTFEGAL